MEQTKFKRFKKITISLIVVLMVTLGSCHFSWCANKHSINNDGIKMEQIYDIKDTSTVIPPSINSRYDSSYTAILNETKKYINKQAPKAHQDLPKFLLDAALENDIDLCFMMAQTQLETNFGTLGAGREVSRRSLFGVYAKRYSTYEYAIDDWCALLHKSYLGKGRTEQHLLNKYTTHSGRRYAENPRYEVELKSTYKRIINCTDLKRMQSEIKNIA